MALFFVTLQWILPTFINGIGIIKEIIKPAGKRLTSVAANASLAPPVLNIPYEATNTAQIDIQGYSSPGSKVKLYIDDTEKQTSDVNADGNFTFQKVTLSLGTNNIYGTTTDDEGKISFASKTLKVIFDNEKPLLTLNEPEDGKNIQGGEKKVKMSGKTETGADVFISEASNDGVVINGTQTIVDKDGNFSTDLALNDGENNFTIKALDSAGNFTETGRRVIYQP